MGYTLITSFAVLGLLTVVSVHAVCQMLQHNDERRHYPLPPGPTPLPFLGNVLSINSRLPWLTYTEWRAKYGDIIYVRLLDTDVIVLNSVSAATALMEKRSGIYSDRPFISTAAPYENDCNFSILSHSGQWRLCRRIFHQTFNANSALKFRPMQLQSARQLIRHVIEDPDEYPSHFQMFSTAFAMSAVYDYQPSFRNDSMVSTINSYVAAAIAGLAPGKILLVKFFPFLLYVPDWLPGSWIRRETMEACEWRNKVIETPYQYVQKRMESREYVSTAMLPDHIVRMENFTDPYRSEYETALKYASATAILGAVESTSTVLMVFTLAMVENPHVWKYAQSSIDTIVGTDRLPNFEDRPYLPYVEAIVRETLRWRPVGPMGFAHAVSRGDIYEGYYIPKGATIVANAWAMSRDEAQYRDAEKFIPERFLNKQGMLTDDDPRDFIFGFGRRKCPGRYAGDASVWIAIVTMLATLDFNLARDADGHDIAFKATFTSGVTEHPDYFPCHLTPRPHVNKEMLDYIL